MDGIISNYANLDTELSLIASVITEPELLAVCLDKKLSPKDFYSKEYKILYEIMISLNASKVEIDITTIAAELKKKNMTTNMSKLAKFIQYSVPMNIESYIKILKDLSYKRRIVDKMLKFIDSAKGLEPSEIQKLNREITKVVEDTDEIETLFADASLIMKENIQDGLQTGFRDIDQCLNGLIYGSLTILTGEPSSGKSTVLNQMIAHNISQKEKVFIYSGELTEYNVLHWFMRTVANPEHLKCFTGRNGPYYDVDSKGDFLIREWIKDKLYIYKQDSTPSIDNLVSTITYLVKNRGVKLIVLDNMMTVDNSGLEELEKQKVLSRRLKQIAQKYKVCVILVAHPKKKEFGKKNYHMHDVSGASEVVNLADYEILLTREIKETNQERVDSTFVSILKNRTTGVQGISRRLHFDSIRKRFYTNKDELERDYEYYLVDNQVGFIEVEDVEEVPF